MSKLKGYKYDPRDIETIRKGIETSLPWPSAILTCEQAARLWDKTARWKEIEKRAKAVLKYEEKKLNTTNKPWPKRWTRLKEGLS